jgi:hypothetical protein
MRHPEQSDFDEHFIESVWWLRLELIPFVDHFELHTILVER